MIYSVGDILTRAEGWTNQAAILAAGLTIRYIGDRAEIRSMADYLGRK